MAASDSEAPVGENLSGALRLLFGAEIAWLCWNLFSAQGRMLLILSRFREPHTVQLSREIEAALWLPEPVLLGVVAFGLMRFVAPLGDVRARRWGYAAASLVGVRAVWNFCLIVLPLTGVELHIQRPSLFVADGILTGASIGAMLLTVRKVNLALALRPPMGVLGFAAGALALGVVSLLLKASPMASSYLLGHDFPLWGKLNAVKHWLDILVHLLLAGALGVTRAGLRRAGAPADGGSDWTAATDSLGLFNRGVFAHLAVCLLATAALPILSGMDVEMDMREAAQRGIMLVGLVFGVMMLVGLLRYASVPGLAGARAYVYAALVLFLNAEWSSQTVLMPWIAVAVLPACFLLLSGSFRRVARMLEEPELAEDALLVALWLFVPGCVAFVLGFFDDLGAFRHFVLFVAVVCVLIGVVRFFLLMGRLRRRMSGRELERKRVGSYADLPHGLS